MGDSHPLVAVIVGLKNPDWPLLGKRTPELCLPSERQSLFSNDSNASLCSPIVLRLQSDLESVGLSKLYRLFFPFNNVRFSLPIYKAPKKRPQKFFSPCRSPSRHLGHREPSLKFPHAGVRSNHKCIPNFTLGSAWFFSVICFCFLLLCATFWKTVKMEIFLFSC